MNCIKRHTSITTLIVGIGLFAFVFAILNTQPVANAQVPQWVPDKIPAGVMPRDTELYLQRCGDTFGDIAQTGWLAFSNDPTKIATTVPYGTSTLRLRYNVAGIVCSNNTGGIQTTTNGVIDTTPANIGLAGSNLTYGYGSSPGEYRTTGVNFDYTANFTATTDVVITLTEKRIHTYINSRGQTIYRCVGAAGAPKNSTDFAACSSVGRPQVSIHVTVIPPNPTPSCTIADARIAADGSYTPTVTLSNSSVAGAPTVNIIGTLAVNGRSANLSTTLTNGQSRTLTATAVTIATPGTYTITGSFSATSSKPRVNFSCQGTLTVDPPPPIVRCESPDKQVLVGDVVGVDFSIFHDGPAGSANVSFNATLILDTKPNQTFNGTVNRFSSASRSGRTYQFSPGVYRYTVNVSTNPSVTVAPCTGTLTILIGPYLRTYGNDVQTGGGFMNTQGLCTTQNSQILAQNRGASAGYAGSGSQIGAFARGAISGFRSASTRADAVNNPTALSFAGTLVAPLQFGGFYGANLCMVDQWSQGQSATPVTTQNIDLASFGNGTATTYLITPANGGAPVTISGLMPNGKRLALYVKGNVLMLPNAAGKVGYASTTWPSINAIPSLYIVTLGNIGIASTVTSMDGQYIAQASSASNGRITTCVNPIGGTLYDPAGLIANCNRQLFVNGSFSATHVNFLRIANNVNQANPSEPATATRAAEVLRYGVEAFISQQAVPTRATQTYDSITALPPSL